MRRRPVLAAAVSAALALPWALGPGGVAHGASDTGEEPSAAGVPLAATADLLRPSGADGGGGAAAKVAGPLLNADGVVTAFVQLDAPSGLDTAEAGGDRADVAAAAVEVEQLAEEVLPEPATAAAPAPVPEAVTVTTNVVAGVVVSGDAARIRALAAQDAVVSVHLMVPKRPANKGTDQLTRAVQAWQATHQTGEGVRIGVIDTGVDYTHAMFGGPGTREAYQDAYGTDGRGEEPEHLFDGAKYLGGYDFAGPRYDANPDSGDPERSTQPSPDENPIDAYYTAPNSGHGTHVAGTAAGYGVTADGTTFRGDYSALENLDGWRIGPGSAPRAGIYALKVFGDRGGSTNLTMQALERAADPNKDLNYNDHLDIVNLSLGADAAPADDPDNLFIDRLAGIGVVSVVAAGNAGDVTDVGGTPGNARSALAVANSVGLTQTFDAVRVVAADDPTLLGVHPAQNSVDYAGGADVTAPVAYLGATVSGCDPLHADDAAKVKGRIVWLWWDDNDATRGCGSRVRWDNAAAAGAVGVLIGTESPIFPAGIAGNAAIPGAQLTAASTDRLLQPIQAGTLVVHLGPSLRGAGFAADPALADLLNPASSRGVHGSLGVGKPDVAAPGTRISSAASGTGDDASTLSGTSMATPHVAGIAALVLAVHPGWTAHQVKAAVMNTATHDVFSDPGQRGPVHGPQRVGAGRVDALDATRTEVIAYATEDPAQVSVELGVIDVGAETVVEHRTVTVLNTGSDAASFTTSYAAATTAGGATITARPAEITVPAGGTALVTVTLTADPATLGRDPDPTSVPAYDFGVPVLREYVGAVSGRLVLTPESGSPLRVPVHAAPRPVSDLSAAPVVFTDPGATTAPLTLRGRGVRSGGWMSLVAPFRLVAEDPRLEDLPSGPGTPGVSASAVAAADLRYVGFASTAPQLAARGGDPRQGSIGIGIVTQGEWATLGTNVVPVVQTDIEGDGTWDLRTYVWKFARGVDFTTVETYALEHSAETGYSLGDLLDLSPVNGLEPGTDSTVFDNNVVVAPINLAAVGIEDGHTPTFVVATLSPYAPGPGDVVDESEAFTADPFKPALWFDAGRRSAESLWFRGTPGTLFTVHRSAAAKDARLLLLHSHNATGRRAEVVELRNAATVTPTTTTLTVEGAMTAGADQLLTAVVAPAAATGTVRFLDGATELGTRRVTSGSASLPVSLTLGTHALQAVFVPDSAEWSASSSAVVTVEVGREVPVLNAVVPTSVRYGSPVLVAALIRTEGPTATGTVQVHEGERLLGSARAFAGWSGAAALVRLPRDLTVGQHVLTVTYLGDAHVAPVSVERVLTVLPARPPRG